MNRDEFIKFALKYDNRKDLDMQRVWGNYFDIMFDDKKPTLEEVFTKLNKGKNMWRNVLFRSDYKNRKNYHEKY